MRYLLILLLATCLQAQVVLQNAVLQNAVLGGGAAGGGGGGITVDLWQDFEMATVSQANLEAQDHCTTGAWATFNSPTSSASGERDMISDVGGVNDAGSYGLVAPPSAQALARYTPATSWAGNAISVGFWVYVAEQHTWNEVSVVTVGTTSTTLFSAMTRANEGPGFFMRLWNGASATDHGSTLSLATWYWVTCKVQRNATCTLRVYNTSGAEVGAAQTITGGDVAADIIQAGNPGDSWTGNIYLDDLVIDWTDATYPLGP